MIKVLEFFHRRPGLAHPDFLAHWRGPHTSVVMGITGVRRYVQNPVRHDLTADAICDGVVELWFSSVAMMRANGQSPWWNEVVADEERFIDRSTTRLLLIDDPAPPDASAGARLFVLVRKPVETGAAEFAAALENLCGMMEQSPDVPAGSVHVDRPFTRPLKHRAETAFVDAVISLCGAEAPLRNVNTTAPWNRVRGIQPHASLLCDCRPILVE